MSANPARPRGPVPLVVLLGLLLAGCSGSPQLGHSDEADAGVGNQVKLETSDKVKLETSDKVKLEVIDEAGFAKVLKFLTEKAATFDNFISPHGVGSKSFEAFEIGDDGIPHFKLFDRQGKLQKTFAGDEPQEIDLAIEELLGET